MGVLLGLGDVQLALAAAGDHLGQRRLRRPRRKRDRVVPALAVLGQRGQVHLGALAPRELVELGLAQRAHQLASPVGAEVEVQDRVAVGDSVVVADHRRADELVGLAALGTSPRWPPRRWRPAGPARGRSRRRRAAFDSSGRRGPSRSSGRSTVPIRPACRSQRSSSARYPAPAVGRVSRPSVNACTTRSGTPSSSGQLDARLDVLPARVDTAVGDQAHQVQAPAGARARRLAGGLQGGVLEEAAVGDRVVDPGQVLLDDRSRAEVEVPDLGVAHLALGKAHVAPAGRQGGVRVALPQTVEDRRRSLADRVSRAPASARPQPSSTTSASEGTGISPGPLGDGHGARGRRDGGEVVRVEAGSADERAVDAVLAEDLGCVAGLHGAAVEDANRLAGRAVVLSPTSERMKAIASAAWSGVALRPVPIAHTGS